MKHDGGPTLHSMSVADKTKLVLLESFLDSGAARSVCPKKFGAQFGLVDTPGSRNGEAFRTATGKRVRNEGAE